MNLSLAQQVRQADTLFEAWRVIHENGRSSTSHNTRAEIDEFAASAGARLRRIQRQLSRGSFIFKPARGVAIPKKGKNAVRPIVIAPVESRIVQRAIHDVLLRIPAIRRYTENPYSFGGIRKREGSDLAAVPAAIQAVLAAIQEGAAYVIRSDITAFFTRIPKATVTSIVADATHEPEFIDLFRHAITVELENLATLRQHAREFPIEEIGVAQGSSLSPLLGNLLLAEFDQQMNAGACRCLRYIDDFIILAPDKKTGIGCFRLGRQLLESHGLETSLEKTSKGSVRDGFQFLGIDMGNGIISPSKEARTRLIQKIRDTMDASARAFRLQVNGVALPSSLSLIKTLSEVRGIVQGWGNHYFFCNQKNLFAQLDHELDALLRQYLGSYKVAIHGANEKGRRRMIGIPLLEEMATCEFAWPKAQPAPMETHMPSPRQDTAPSLKSELSRAPMAG
jgi:RNA-directed DNA polymerase